MTLKDLKWWHWTLITIAVVGGFRIAMNSFAAKPAPAPEIARPL